MAGDLPPDLFDTTTLVSLGATVLIVIAAVFASRAVLPATASTAVRTLFIWHAADALCHFVLEGSFLYHCLFSYIPAKEASRMAGLWPTPYNFLGHGAERVYGPQAGGDNFFAQLWMVYARADKRWAGAELGVIALEILTVFVVAPLATYVCYLLSKHDPRANIWMIVIATSELYGGFMTFAPEWLVHNVNLDGSNFMYLWLYLVFFNVLWVFFPVYAIYYSFGEINDAFKTHATTHAKRKHK